MKVKKNIRSKDLLEMKQLLEVDLQATKVQLEDLSRDNFSEIDDLHGDSVDVASAESAQTSRTKRAIRLKSKILKIEHALNKFKDDSYGICELSEEEIPIARPRLRPFTQYTVESKEELERQEKRFSNKKIEDRESFEESEEASE